MSATAKPDGMTARDWTIRCAERKRDRKAEAYDDLLAALLAVESALNTRGRDDTLLIVVRAAIAKAKGEA